MKDTQKGFCENQETRREEKHREKEREREKLQAEDTGRVYIYVNGVIIYFCG